MKVFKVSIACAILALASVKPVFSQENNEVKTPTENEKLIEKAAWIKENKEAIYGVSEGKYEKPSWGYYTKKDDVVYAHVYNWPTDGKLVIDRNMKVRRAFLNYGATKLKTLLIDNKLTIFLPKEKLNDIANVIKIQLTSSEDWANFKRYRRENTKLKAPTKNENRVVLIGNSITDFWKRDRGQFFKDHSNYVNRGISGQTSSQMLLRFRPDVIALKPKVVVICAGTNDIAGNTGPISIEAIAGNIFSMVELAKANNIKVVLASVLPASSFSWSPSVEPIDKINQLNILIKAYAIENNVTYLDYYAHMVNDENGLKEELGRDTVHPNTAGYEIMEPLVNAAIQKALE